MKPETRLRRRLEQLEDEHLLLENTLMSCLHRIHGDGKALGRTYRTDEEAAGWRIIGLIAKREKAELRREEREERTR